MKHVVITGFMASGKTTVGRRLANRLGRDFIDLDELIEKREGTTISEIFASRGEAAFREIERETVASLVPERPTVVATGGGTFVNAGSRDALRKLGVVVCLITTLETILRRVARNDKRPLASGPGAEERLRRLLEERMPAYRLADVLVETDGVTADQAVTRVLKMIEPRLGKGSRRGSAAAGGGGPAR